MIKVKVRLKDSLIENLLTINSDADLKKFADNVNSGAIIDYEVLG